MKQQNINAKTKTRVRPEQTAAQPKPPAPTSEQIQKRAYALHMAQGGKSHPLIDWLRAENELKSELRLQMDSAECNGH